MTTLAAQQPKIILVPGLHNSGPGHWQTLWEERRGDCIRAQLGQWDQPHRNSWVNQLGLAIRHARGNLGGQNGGQSEPAVVLVAHSLGCHAVAWWAQLEPEAADLVQGALLVAPAEVDFFPLDERLTSFAPTPSQELPFPSILVASQNDPYMGIHTARQLARRWGAGFVDSGALGHINADSGLGDWPQGQALLGELLAAAGYGERAERNKRPGRKLVRTAGLEPARAKLKGF